MINRDQETCLKSPLKTIITGKISPSREQDYPLGFPCRERRTNYVSPRPFPAAGGLGGLGGSHYPHLSKREYQGRRRFCVCLLSGKRRRGFLYPSCRLYTEHFPILTLEKKKKTAAFFHPVHEAKGGGGRSYKEQHYVGYVL